MKLNYGDRAAREVSQRIAAPVATVAALKAIPAANRVDGMVSLITADGSLWWFNSSSTAGASSTVLVPDAGSGRWESLGGAGGGGVDYKASVRGASTANIANLASFTVAGVDGLTYVEGDRILLKDQSTGSQNGIYLVGAVGGGTAALTRAPDANTSAEVTAGMLVPVEAGTVSGGRIYSLTTTGTITLGTTSLTFSLVAGALTSTVATTIAPDDAAAAGTATTAARADHVHAIAAAAPTIRNGMTLGEGVSTSFSRADHVHAGGTLYARGVVFADVANLASFTVAGNDGLTYVEGDRVLLANQTTAAQCGLYTVGAVGGGTAALTRATEMPAAAAMLNGQVVEVSEGTIWAGSSWKAMCTGAAVVGTNDPLFYPRVCKGTLTLASGTKTVGATEGLFLLSTTTSSIQLCFNTAGGTKTGTVDYGAAVASRTAGKSGTGAFIALAVVEAGTIQNQDNSTLDWLVTNW